MSFGLDGRYGHWLSERRRSHWRFHFAPNSALSSDHYVEAQSRRREYVSLSVHIQFTPHRRIRICVCAIIIVVSNGVLLLADILKGTRPKNISAPFRLIYCHLGICKAWPCPAIIRWVDKKRQWQWCERVKFQIDRLYVSALQFHATPLSTLAWVWIWI